MRNKKQLLARTLATAMACVMPFTMCPVTAFAAGESEQSASQAGYVYGTVDLPYADYYYGELNQVSEMAEMDLTTSDKAAAYRETGMYDAVSSATTTKYKGFAAAYYTENEDAATGGTIGGIKDVSVAVPESLYNEAKQAISSGKECSNPLLNIVGNMAVTETVPTEYKVLNGDGTLTEMKDSAAKTVISDAQISVANSTTWGQYQISIVSDNLPEKEDMEAVIIETTDGAKYGMKHLENLWFRTGEIAFAVKDGFKVPQGNALTSARYADLQGKTVSKITYVVRGGADVVFDTNLFMKTLLDKKGDYHYSGENAIYMDGAQITMNGITPKDSNYELSGITFKNNVLTRGTDYTYENNVLTIKETENTGIGTYTLTYSDEKYENIQTTVQFTSSMTSDEIAIVDNSLRITNKEVTLEAYIAAIDSIKVNGTALRGNNLGTTVFNPDGSVNFAAELSLRGNKTIVFPDADAEYTIEVTSAGYPSVSGTAKSPSSVIDTTALQRAIESAKALNQSDYTTETWKLVETELAEAEAEFAAPQSQAAVDEAALQLNSAVEALEKAVKLISGVKVSLSQTKYYYDGKLKKPSVTIENLVAGTDYTVSYKNNKNIGKATVTVKGIGNYTGTVTKTFTITIKKGAAYKSGSLKYKITKASSTGKGTVEVMAPVNQKVSSITIPAAVKIGGVSFNVTSIGKNAFKNCTKLKTIKVKSAKITKVGSNALKGINKNAVIKVPSSKLKAYTKLLKGKGQGTKVKITK